MRIRTILAGLSLASLTCSQASAAQDCVSEAEVAALFVYAMPSMLDSARNSCDKQLRSNGFFKTNGSQLIGRYAALQNETWPRAKRAVLLFASAYQKQAGRATPAANGFGGLDTNALLGSLPDNVARPLVDAIIVQRVAEELKPEQCRNVERVAQAIAPIEPRLAAVLIGTMMSLVGLDEPKICNSEAP